MSWTQAQQAVFDHLVAQPGPVIRAAPPGHGGWIASVSGDGGAGADPGTVRFTKSRTFPGCELHEADFVTRDGQAQHMLVRTWQRPDGSWAADPIGGGGAVEPCRSRPWVNLAASWNAQHFTAGGHVTGQGCEAARVVRLTFADGTAVADTVDNGVVLFFAQTSVTFPALVEVLDAAGVTLAEYDEFSDFG